MISFFYNTAIRKVNTDGTSEGVISHRKMHSIFYRNKIDQVDSSIIVSDGR